MKINITKTVLGAMPDIAWGMFCRFMTDSDVEYTPIQKPAALYLRYYFAVCEGGHAEFLELYEGADIGEIMEALTMICGQEPTDNLLNAMENGSQDNYEEADAWFDENAGTLLKAIKSYWENNIDEFYEIIDEDYTMRPYKAILWISVVLASIVFTAMTVIALTQTILFYPAFFLMFFAFASPFLVLIAYCVFWSVSVKGDVLIIRRPFRKKRAIQIADILGVRKKRDRLIIYVRGEKAAVIRNEVTEYRMLLAQLDLAGKMKEIQLNGFSIREPNASIVSGVMWPIFAIGGLIWSTSLRHDPDIIYLSSLFAVLTLIALWYFLFRLPLKLNVSEDTISVKHVLGQEKKYHINDISKVKISDGNAAVFVHNKKLIAIASVSEGYSALMQRLDSEKIPFERNYGAAKGNKAKKHTIKASLEEQLNVLADLGIKPVHGDFVEWVCGEWGRKRIEIDPYNLLLYSLGGERELEAGQWEPLSDDIYNIDTECVEGNDIYATIIRRLAAISKGGFNALNVSSKVNHRLGKASVVFSLHDKEYSWQLNYNGDWFDPDVIGRINYLLKSEGSSKFFFVSNPDQSITLIFDSDENVKKLNALIEAPFDLIIADSES